MATDVNVPTLGESITEATVGQWLKNPGDAVALDEPIVALETDKVSVEVNSPVAGTLAEQLVKEGDTVAVGALIARIGEGGAPALTAAAPAAPATPAAVKHEPEPEAEVAGAPVNPAGAGETPRPRESDDPAPPHDAALTLSPAVRRAVLANHVDPSAIKGSGKDGRITKDDVLAAATAKTNSPAPAPAPAPAASAPAARPAPTAERREERVKISRMRQTIATRLKEAQNTAALLTTFNDVDMTAVIDARARYKDLFEKKHDIRLGFMGFFVKAVSEALKRHPVVNASTEGQDVIYHGYCDVAIAVSTERGLVTPVLRNAELKSLAEIEREISAYAKKAREGGLALEDLQGGTFTITNGGTFGSLMSTPIVNPPQSAILGMHAIKDRPIAENGQVVIAPMMYVALSYDHRIIDGKDAVLFLVDVKNSLENPHRLLLGL